MYIPPPYRDEKYNQFTIIHDGHFFRCKKYWSVKRSHEGHFTLFVQERCKLFTIKMILNVFDCRVETRLMLYSLDVSTRREYRYMLIYLRFYCNKMKHRPYYEVKDVIAKHFLRLGIYLDSSVSQLIVFFHSCSTTFGDEELIANDVNINRQYRLRLLSSW
jgi:hypothetical protein